MFDLRISTTILESIILANGNKTIKEFYLDNLIDPQLTGGRKRILFIPQIPAHFISQAAPSCAALPSPNHHKLGATRPCTPAAVGTGLLAPQSRRPGTWLLFYGQADPGQHRARCAICGLRTAAGHRHPFDKETESTAYQKTGIWRKTLVRKICVCF